ncbi:MAG: hypothetical protein KME05_15440 [Gloeocapsa sp. UFS-A4-WI-NPMV-4B04]|jgi:hypothetical protein|nr:hypothetical protein [Gloeocapsa sp. UFS-A4-WI-NPMV-4B04]
MTKSVRRNKYPLTDLDRIEWDGDPSDDGFMDADVWTVVLADGTREVILDRSELEDDTYEYLLELHDTM